MKRDTVTNYLYNFVLLKNLNFVILYIKKTRNNKVQIHQLYISISFQFWLFIKIMKNYFFLQSRLKRLNLIYRVLSNLA